MSNILSIQLGKQGLTESFLENLKHLFENKQNVKINVLKSATRSKDDLKEISEKIVEFLGDKYTCRVIGYTIAVKKWRRSKTSN